MARRAHGRLHRRGHQHRRLGIGPERLAGQLADHAADADGLLLVADVALTSVVAPVTEELVFRGLLLGGLLAWWTRQGTSRPSRLQLAAAVLVSAVAFRISTRGDPA